MSDKSKSRSKKRNTSRGTRTSRPKQVAAKIIRPSRGNTSRKEDSSHKEEVRRVIRRHDVEATNSASADRKNNSNIDENMSLIELQKIARSKGIPFGGLKKSQLIRKILTY